MKDQILYVEQKTGFNNNGSAWVGRGSFSKSGRTIYFNDKAFQSTKGAGIDGNYQDIETGDEYWVSGVKKDQQDRHWGGSGFIEIDESVVMEYLRIIGSERLSPGKFKVVRFKKGNIVNRIQKLENNQIK